MKNNTSRLIMFFRYLFFRERDKYNIDEAEKKKICENIRRGIRETKNGRS